MNLEIYNNVRSVPKEAKKPISAGRLKGMTDINPMWRIKALTEQFGPVGKGWYYKIIDKRLERGCKDQISAFVDIELYVKYGDEWSMPILGTGGSSFVAQEKNGPYQSDECFKMALTDAISIACKALGFGADVYWDKDRTKYDSGNEEVSEWDKNCVIGFGKHNGKTMLEIYQNHFDYIEYLSENASDEGLKSYCIKLVEHNKNK